jgi:hypothetical protein
MNRYWLVVVALFLVACSSKQSTSNPPNNEVVLRLINSKYGSYQRALDVDIGRTGTDCFFTGGVTLDIGYRPEKDLGTVIGVKAGLLSVKPAEKDRWDVSLTEKGESFLKAEGGGKPFNHREGNRCDEYQVTFPVARAEASDLVGPQAEGTDAYRYTYSWKWKPSTLGLALRKDGDVYSKLSSSQQSDLPKRINAIQDPELKGGPDLPMPVPSDAESASHPGSAVIKKYDKYWRAELKQ